MDDFLIRLEFFLNFPREFESTLLVCWAIASLVFTGEPIYRAIRYREPHPFEFWPSIVFLQVTAALALNCLWHVIQRVLGAMQDCEAIGAPIVFPWLSAPVSGESCSAIELATYGNYGMLLLVLFLLWPILIFRRVVWSDAELID